MKFYKKRSVVVTRVLLSAVISSQLVTGTAYAQESAPAPAPESAAAEGAPAEGAAEEASSGSAGGVAGAIANAPLIGIIGAIAAGALLLDALNDDDNPAPAPAPRRLGPAPLRAAPALVRWKPAHMPCFLRYP